MYPFGLRALSLLGALLITVGCGALRPPKAVGPGQPAVADGAARLTRTVVPQHYTLNLSVEPRGATLAGESRIRLKLARPTQALHLHASDLSIESAALKQGTRRWPAQAELGPGGTLTLRFAESIPAGDAELVIRFHRALLRAPRGAYRLQLDDAWYVFTQFEAMHAREAFPCFDEPSFKTPFTVSLRVPEGQLAVANAPEAAHQTEGGWTTFTFAETRPLPTYLVAFAVGPFDVVTAEGDGEVKLRLLAAKGRGRLARFALERAGELLGWMTEWFGRPYPFAKLDLLAVPGLAAGAMENAGLITFRETLLLLDEATAPPQRRLWAQLILAHELTHAWIGNLITPGWWDEVWITEAFATWLATRAVSAVEPELDAALESAARTHWVMSLDSQRGARPIRRSIDGAADIHAAFDRLAYVKGAALLRMIDAWIGDEAFQKGVRAWMERYAYATADAASLIDALQQASNLPVGTALTPFLDQPGIPLVRATLTCGPTGASVHLSQRPYGPKAAAGAPLWAVPVCLSVGRGETRTRTCHLLTQAEATVPLPGACPQWIHPNADQSGYYRWHLPADALHALVGTHYTHLSALERAAIIGQLEAQLEVGVLPLPAYLDALITLSSQTDHIVIGQLINALARLHTVAVDPDEAEAFSAFTRQLLEPHRTRLGELSTEEEPAENTLLRPRLLDALAYLARDPGLRQRARSVINQFTAEPEDVDAKDLVRLLPMAAWKGDLELWTKLRGTLDRDPEPIIRAAVVTALGAFEDPALLTRSLNLLVDGTLTASDHRSLTRAISHPDARRAAWRWLTTHYGALAERLGPTQARGLVWLGAGFCSLKDRDTVQRFFTDPRHAPPGTDRNLALVLHGIENCASLRATIDAPLQAWLKQR
jgi:alanyl aminopeptidase